MLAAMALSGVLAIATSFSDTRRALGFLYWSWIVWLVALLVNDFVVGVFAWSAGLATMVIAMEPSAPACGRRGIPFGADYSLGGNAAARPPVHSALPAHSGPNIFD